MWQRAPPAHSVHTSVLELPFLCHSSQFSLCSGLLHIECNCIDLQLEDRVKPQSSRQRVCNLLLEQFYLD